MRQHPLFNGLFNIPAWQLILIAIKMLPEGLYVSQLAGRTNMHYSYCGKLCREMCDKYRWLKCEKIGPRKNMKYYSLTEKGEDLADSLIAIFNELGRLGLLDPKDRMRFSSNRLCLK